MCTATTLSARADLHPPRPPALPDPHPKHARPLRACPRQLVPRLSGSLPVWIDGEGGWEDVAEALDDIFLGDAEIWWGR